MKLIVPIIKIFLKIELILLYHLKCSNKRFVTVIWLTVCTTAFNHRSKQCYSMSYNAFFHSSMHIRGFANHVRDYKLHPLFASSSDLND